MNYIGIDNGVSGSIGIISEFEVSLHTTPVKLCLNYQKVLTKINRVDVSELERLLPNDVGNSLCMIERPMVNPMRFDASLSAIRAFEATLIVLDRMSVPYSVVDSREWQRALLPSGLWKMTDGKVVNGKKRKGGLKAEPKELKFASLQTCARLFPSISLKGFKDADGLLIAKFCELRHRSGR